MKLEVYQQFPQIISAVTQHPAYMLLVQLERFLPKKKKVRTNKLIPKWWEVMSQTEVRCRRAGLNLSTSTGPRGSWYIVYYQHE